MYRIKLTELAAQKLQGIEATARSQIIRKIDQLKEAPELLGKALSGPLKEFSSDLHVRPVNGIGLSTELKRHWLS